MDTASMTRTPLPPTEGAEIVRKLSQMSRVRGMWTDADREYAARAATHITTQEAELTRLRQRVAELEEAEAEGCHGLDTPERVCFYEQDFYVLSNFSAFSVQWETSRREGLVKFDTSEAVYHWERFNSGVPTADQRAAQHVIRTSLSAHEAFIYAQQNKYLQRKDWDEVKIEVMKRILRVKAQQHEYVHRKLLATGDRELVENSWRDDFWGWGPNRDGQNMLGRLWMEIREELRSALTHQSNGDTSNGQG